MPMESREESIRLLKKRMHQQMNDSSGRDINPENIQYYASSLMKDMYLKENMRLEEEIQQEISADEDDNRVEAVLEESEENEELSSEAAFTEKPGEIPPAMNDIKVVETAEVQHERAKNEYEKVLHAMDEEEIFGYRQMHWLNIKG